MDFTETLKKRRIPIIGFKRSGIRSCARCKSLLRLKVWLALLTHSLFPKRHINHKHNSNKDASPVKANTKLSIMKKVISTLPSTSAAVRCILFLFLSCMLHDSALGQQQSQNALTRRVSLPTVSIYMLCGNSNITSIDFTAEMESYYNDLLSTSTSPTQGGDDTSPSAGGLSYTVKDIQITGTSSFDDCNLEPDKTQTKLHMDGSVRLILLEDSDTTSAGGDTDDIDAKLQEEIQKMVISASLLKHFQGICFNELDIFKAAIVPSNEGGTTTAATEAEDIDQEPSSSGGGEGYSFAFEERYISTICTLNQDSAKAVGITGITIALIVMFCILVCLFLFICCICRGGGGGGGKRLW